MGPKFGYFPEGSKSWIIVRENAKERVQTIFDITKIQIITDGQRHLGAVIGTANFKQNYMKETISQWIQELRISSKIAWYEPQLTRVSSQVSNINQRISCAQFQTSVKNLNK